MKKFVIAISPILALWALLLIVVPKYDLFNVHILKYIMQSVMITGLLVFGLSLGYIAIRILLLMFTLFRGQQFFNKEVLTNAVISLQPAQTLAFRAWLFVVSFIGVGFLATYIGKLFE